MSKLVESRQRIEAKIEELIGLLDLLDGDENLEPYLAGFDDRHLDDREDENENGGDIQDEPHDARDEGNDEPSLGWKNPLAPTFQELALMPTDELDFEPADAVPLGFNGDGYHIARKMLREVVKDHRKVAKALEATRVSPGYGRYV